jgi:hypothetical protein
MRHLSLSQAWDETKAIIAREGRLLAAVTLALVVLPQVILAVAGLPIGPEASSLSQLLYAAVILLGFVAQVALNRLAIGPAVTVREAMGDGFIRLPSIFLVFLILSIGLGLITIVFAIVMAATGLVVLQDASRPPSSIVAILIVLTALIFAVFQLVFPVAAVETGNPIRLISRSWQLARGNYLRLLVFVMIAFVGLGLVAAATKLGFGSVIVLFLGRPDPGSMSALVLGLIASTIQAAFTVVTAVMLARIYVQLAGRGGVAGVPSSGI